MIIYALFHWNNHEFRLVEMEMQLLEQSTQGTTIILNKCVFGSNLLLFCQEINVTIHCNCLS